MRKVLRLTVFVAAITAIFLGAGCAGKKKKKKDDPAAMEGGCWDTEGCTAKEGCGEGCGCAAKEGCGCATAEGCAGEGCGCGGCGCGDADAEPVLTEESIDDVLEREQVDAARIAKLKASLKEFAERSRSGGNLHEAREAWKKLLILDPGDKQAADMFRQISIELGDRVPVVADILEGTGQIERARKEQTQLEIRRLQTRAREHENGKEYQEAINLYERMLSILEWYPYQADFSITSDQVRGLIEGARERLKRSQRDLLNRSIRTFEAEEKGRREEALKEEMRQMQVWLRLATEAFDRGEYLLAQTNAQKLLTIDPQNKAAQELIRIAKETQYVADRTEIRQQFSDQWRSIMENLELSALPHPQILTFPKNWSSITQRQPVTAGDTTADEIDPLTQRIRNTLSQQRLKDINWEAGEITLENAIAYIRSVTGLNFVLSQKVKEEKAEVEIELKVDNVPVDQVLKFITEPHEMTWKIEYGVVMILDKDEALAKPVLRFYDVKDLVAKIQDFPGQDVNLIPSKYQPPEEEEPEDPVSPFEVDQLIEVIQTTVEPESWDAIEGAEIQPKSNVLVIRTIPEVHQKIARLLSDLRKNTGILVSLEVRFLAAEDRFLRDIGVDIRGLGDQTGGTGVPGKGVVSTFDDNFVGSVADPQGTGQAGVNPEPSSIGTSTNPGAFFADGGDGEYKARVENLFDFILGFDVPGRATAQAQNATLRDNQGGLSLQATFIDDTQLEVILRAVEKSERIEQISAPRLTVHDTQRANVSVMTQNSYVQDFDVEIAQAAAIGDPIIQTIRDGIILDVRPIVSADRRYITMELRPTVAQLVRPIPTFQTSLATGPPVTIQVPELAISRVRTTVTMPDGGTLLLGGIKFYRDSKAESGVPILSQIPILGFLFSRKAKVIQRRNLLIVVKANVILMEEHAPGFGIR